MARVSSYENMLKRMKRELYQHAPAKTLVERADELLPEWRTNPQYAGMSDDDIKSLIIKSLKMQNLAYINLMSKSGSMKLGRPDNDSWNRFTPEEILDIYYEGVENVPEEVLEWAMTEFNNDITEYELDDSVALSNDDIDDLNIIDQNNMEQRKVIQKFSAKIDSQNNLLEKDNLELSESKNKVQENYEDLSEQKNDMAENIKKLNAEAAQTAQKIKPGEQVPQGELDRYEQKAAILADKNKDFTLQTKNLETDLQELFDSVADINNTINVTKQMDDSLSFLSKTYGIQESGITLKYDIKQDAAFGKIQEYMNAAKSQNISSNALDSSVELETQIDLAALNKKSGEQIKDFSNEIVGSLDMQTSANSQVDKPDEFLTGTELQAQEALQTPLTDEVQTEENEETAEVNAVEEAEEVTAEPQETEVVQETSETAEIAETDELAAQDEIEPQESEEQVEDIQTPLTDEVQTEENEETAEVNSIGETEEVTTEPQETEVVQETSETAEIAETDELAAQDEIEPQESEEQVEDIQTPLTDEVQTEENEETAEVNAVEESEEVTAEPQGAEVVSESFGAAAPEAVSKTSETKETTNLPASEDIDLADEFEQIDGGPVSEQQQVEEKEDTEEVQQNETDTTEVNVFAGNNGQRQSDLNYEAERLRDELSRIENIVEEEDSKSEQIPQLEEAQDASETEAALIEPDAMQELIDGDKNSVIIPVTVEKKLLDTGTAVPAENPEPLSGQDSLSNLQLKSEDIISRLTAIENEAYEVNSKIKSDNVRIQELNSKNETINNSFQGNSDKHTEKVVYEAAEQTENEENLNELSLDKAVQTVENINIQASNTEASKYGLMSYAEKQEKKDDDDDTNRRIFVRFERSKQNKMKNKVQKVNGAARLKG